MTAIRRTPFTRLGDAIEQRAGRIGGYVASSVISLVPTTLLITWLAVHRPHDSLWWPVLLLAILTLLTPGLIRFWERWFARLLDLLAASAEDSGWDTASIGHAVGRVDAAFWPMNVFTIGFAALFFAFFATPGLDRLGIDDVRGRIAAAVVGAVFAHSVAIGLWIVTRLVVVTATALDSPPQWRPFRSRQATGIESISSLAAFTGVMFSVGSLAIPAWIEAGRSAPAAAQAFTVSGTALFLTMGSVAFLIPQVMLLRFLVRARQARMDQLATLMERLADEIAATEIDKAIAPRKHAVLERLIRLHGAFTAVEAAHLALARGSSVPATLHTVSRALTTIVLPVGALVLQTVTAT